MHSYWQPIHTENYYEREQLRVTKLNTFEEEPFDDFDALSILQVIRTRYWTT